MDYKHTPVLLNEVLEWLKINHGIYVDATVGGGGYASKILERLGPAGSLIGIDCDQDALNYTSKYLSQYYNKQLKLIKGNFSDILNILKKMEVNEIQGIVFDLGISSYQVDFAPRGFSFRADALLDMRMDQTQKLTAKDLINKLSKEELSRILRDYGQEPYARKIAGLIIQEKGKKMIKTTRELAEIVKRAVRYKKKIHPATKTFQALRIAVNKELENLSLGLENALKLLAKNGRILVISYHSLEDKIVKQFFNKYSGKCICNPGLIICQCNSQKKLKVLTKKPIAPAKEEILINPRARSAKLRVACKI